MLEGHGLPLIRNALRIDKPIDVDWNIIDYMIMETDIKNYRHIYTWYYKRDK